MSGGGAQAFQHAQESAVALEVDDLCVCVCVCVCVHVCCITSKPTAHIYKDTYNKDLVYFLIRKLTFGLLSDNVAVHLLQDDTKLGPLTCLSPHHPG